MTGFRILLGAFLGALLIYTVVVVVDHGLNYVPTAYGDIAGMAWAGQFDVDFLEMLTVSGLWVAWRHQFSAAGLALGVLAFLGGALFLGVYLLVLSLRAKAGLPEILLGPSRVAGLG